MLMAMAVKKFRRRTAVVALTEVAFCLPGPGGQIISNTIFFFLRKTKQKSKNPQRPADGKTKGKREHRPE